MHKVIEDKDILFLTKRIFKNSFKYFFFHIMIKDMIMRGEPSYNKEQWVAFNQKFRNCELVS